MNKWKCTVCNFVMDSEKVPERCIHCFADSHKIKPMFGMLKKRYDLMD